MTKIFRTALVKYSDQQMYDLVNDVAKYPEFLPWCKSSSILLQTPTRMSAILEVSKSGVNRSFETSNQLNNPKSIIMNLANGPFKKLQGEWLFDVLGDQGCKVSLNLEFEFSNGIMGMMLKKVFEPAANEMLDAFVKRSREIYG